MLNTPDEYDGPEHRNKARFSLQKTRPALVVSTIVVLALIGFAGKEFVPVVGMLILYLVENAPAALKAKIKKFLAVLVESFHGCRTCQA